MADTDDDASLAGIARDLYAQLPAEFVAARNARAAEVRRAGDRGLATRVKALPKPSAPAWAVGLVAREEPGELDALGELGAELRVAQASANPVELRALGKRRRQLAAALTRTAARLAKERGVPLSTAAQEQVELTWQAVVIERAAERAVRSLLLVRTLEPGDLGGVALDGALAVPFDEDGATDDDGDDEPAPPPRRRTGLRAVPRPAEDEAESREPGGPANDEGARRSRRGEDGDDEGPVRRSRRGEDGDDGGDEPTAPRRPGAAKGAGSGRSSRRTAVGGKDAPSSREAATLDEPARTRGDVARETRRAERELRSRERVAKQARADLEEAQEELTRLEARVLQVAAHAEELRRELEQLEEELEELDEERSAAQEEREDAEEREVAAARAVDEVRDRLAELAQE